MAKKLTLDVESMINDFFEDAYLLGIVCSLPIHRLTWHIYDKLDLCFFNNWDDDIVVRKNNNTEYTFPYYAATIPIKSATYSLYTLKSQNERLLPELQNMDYLWMFQGPTAWSDLEIYTPSLKLLPGVQFVQPIAVDQLINVNNLLV